MSDEASALDRLRARKAGRDAADQAAVDRGKKTIVVVDDEKGNLDAIVRVLGTRFEVVVFEEASLAFEHIKETGCPDLIITDQRMPRMTGVELLSAVVQVYPYATGMILSGYTERNDLVGAINEAHCFAYVTKPWRPAMLVETIEKGLITSEKRRAEGDRNKRLSEISTRLGSLDANSDVDDFLAGFDDLEAELEALAEG